MQGTEKGDCLKSQGKEKMGLPNYLPMNWCRYDYFCPHAEGRRERRGREVYSLENLNQTGLESKHRRSAGVRHGIEIETLTAQ